MTTEIIDPSDYPDSARASGFIGGRDGMGMYLDEIARTPLLDAEREVELSKRIEAGLYAEHLLAEQCTNVSDPTATNEELAWLAEDGNRATQHFIQANLRLVVSIARKYGRSAMPMLDLVQEGNTGLIRAVEKFDYQKGFKFSTYATWWVRQAITRGIAQQARIVRLPVHVVEDLNQLGAARRNLERQLGREPEPAELAAELDMTEERVLDLLDWGRDHVSLDTPIDDDGDTSLGDLVAREPLPGPEAVVLSDMERQELNDLVELLDPRSADVIRSRFGLIDGRQEKLADIGARHGVSAERVRQIEREALAQLRQLDASRKNGTEESVSSAKPSDSRPPAESSAKSVKSPPARRGRLLTNKEYDTFRNLLINPPAPAPNLSSEELNALVQYVQYRSISEVAKALKVSMPTASRVVRSGLRALGMNA